MREVVVLLLCGCSVNNIFHIYIYIYIYIYI
jgi:hypothetical protein